MTPQEAMENRMVPAASQSVHGGIGRSVIAWTMLALLITGMLLFVVLPAVSGVLSSRYSIQFQDLYDLIANNLTHGYGYRIEPQLGETMIREPGYPLFLAIVFQLGGYSLEAARIANMFLAVAICWVMVRLTSRVTPAKPAALLACSLFLFHPGTLIAVARGGVEITLILLVTLFVLFLHRALDSGQLWRYCLAGAFIGVATLVRSEMMWFPAFLVAYFFATAKGLKERVSIVKRFSALCAVAALVVLPWVVRNYKLTGQVVPGASVAGVAVHEGLYTCQNLSSSRDFSTVQSEAGLYRGELAARMGAPFIGRYYYQFFYSPTDEVNFGKALFKEAMATYRKDPMLLADCSARNVFFNFWFLGKTWQASRWNMLVQLPLLLLALTGCALLWRRGLLRNGAILLAFIVYVPAVHAPIIAHARHSIVVMPFLAILASIALTSLREEVAARRVRRQSIGASIASSGVLQP